MGNKKHRPRRSEAFNDFIDVIDAPTSCEMVLGWTTGNHPSPGNVIHFVHREPASRFT